MRILLIEDDPDIFTLLDILFQREKFELVWAETAQEALQIFDEAIPDLIISDLGLPDVDGMFLVQVFKQKSPKTPVILLTARDNEADKASMLAAGAQDYVLKPFEPEEFIKRVKVFQKAG